METMPTIHLNGTNGQDLFDGWLNLHAQLSKALEAFKGVEFNARDYYPKGHDAWGKAREEFAVMQRAVEIVREKVMAVCMHVQDSMQETT